MLTCRKPDWVRHPPGDRSRAEACLSGSPFLPHRHDNYALCITTGGVQVFDYRGATRYSVPKGIVVIHPDELHDGRAGTDEPFSYRGVSVAPARLQTILGGAPLPHLEGGTSDDPRLASALGALLNDFERPLEPLEYDDLMFSLARALAAVCGTPTETRRIDYQAAELARAYINDAADSTVTMDSLESVTGRSRWHLSRDFRSAFGTSPYRYLVLRRLDRARALIERGESGTQVAMACGFSDQSHFIRQFRLAYGLTPSRWRALNMRGASTIVQSKS